jgi:hypothetical protein
MGQRETRPRSNYWSVFHFHFWSFFWAGTPKPKPKPDTSPKTAPPSLIRPQVSVLGILHAKRASGSQIRQFVAKCIKVALIMPTLAWRTLPVLARLTIIACKLHHDFCPLRRWRWPRPRLLPANTVQYHTASAWA